MGGALGILVGYWGKQLLPGPPGQMTALDWRILIFVLALTGLTGLIFGIAPAFRGTGMNVNSALKETSRGVVGSRSMLGKSLLIVQVAISLVLLVGAGLFLRTLQNLRHVEVGFNPQNLLLFRVNPSLNRYDEKRMTTLYRDMLDRIGTVPGVRGVALSAPALLSGSVNATSIYVQGRAYDPAVRDQNNDINRLVISPNFFELMEIPVLLGRGFTDRDDASSQKVVVINEAAVRKYFPNENPDRPAVWLEHRNERRSRGRRRAARRRSTTAFATRRRRRCMCPTSRRGSAARCSKCARPASPRAPPAPSARPSGRSIRTCR